jgi:hypothetical protein
MRILFSCFAFFFRFVAVVVFVSACNAFADRATTASHATVVEPARVSENVRIWTTSSFASGMTGDLIIRHAAAGPATISLSDEHDTLGSGTSALHVGPSIESVESAISAWHAQLADCTGSACSTRPEAGVLDGNPVNSIDISTSEADETSPTNITVIVTYN